METEKLDRIRGILWVLLNISRTNSEIFEIMQALGEEKGLEVWAEHVSNGDRKKLLKELKDSF